MTRNEIIEQKILNNILHLRDTVEHKANLTIKPLHKGEGRIIGYLFRQFLSQSVRGNAISGLKIEGIDSVYTAIPKIYEDVYKIISNLKKIIIKTKNKNDFIIRVNVSEIGEVRAKDFILPAGVEIVNPEQLICKITEQTDFKMNCLVSSGVGFVSETEMELWQKNNNMWMIGANYGPVTNVKTEVSDIASGRNVAMEELVMEIQTNGSVTPLEAATQVAQRICDMLKGFLTQTSEEIPSAENVSHLQFDQILLESISTLGLGNRAQACMEHLKIGQLGDLVSKSVADLLAVPNIGQNTVNEITSKLASKGLELEMVVSGWDAYKMSCVE